MTGQFIPSTPKSLSIRLCLSFTHRGLLQKLRRNFYVDRSVRGIEVAIPWKRYWEEKSVSVVHCQHTWLDVVASDRHTTVICSTRGSNAQCIGRNIFKSRSLFSYCYITQLNRKYTHDHKHCGISKLPCKTIHELSTMQLLSAMMKQALLLSTFTCRRLWEAHTNIF